MGKHAYAIRGANKLYYCALFTDGLTTLKSLSNICYKGRIKSCCATLCEMQQARLSGDNAVLAFPTFASVQLSTALELTGRSQSGGVVFAQQLFAGHVPQLDGSRNGLAQKIPFIF